MENIQYSPEFLPMQSNNYERLKEPRAVTLVSRSSTVGNAAAPAASPRDHIVWSLFNTMYMNYFCLGFIALYFSVKARDRKVIGDLEGACEYGATARCLNLTSLILFFITLVIVIILVSVGVFQVIHFQQNPLSRGSGGD
ncbi:interferon-induced transmembrane protein 1 [Amia ocellicauda]|uniref:interferon-induced transmembrane protein 1 n=1 Tax=Amia ocellicauda TaxID=2972642 RepID=UPI003463E7FB